MGNFNLKLHDRHVIRHTAVVPLIEWISTHLTNCFPQDKPTFTRRTTRGTQRSTIDYIYGHTSLSTRLVNPQHDYIPSAWSDHDLLMVDLLQPRMDIGPGSWRFNPTLLTDKHFLSFLDITVVTFFSSLVLNSASAQEFGNILIYFEIHCTILYEALQKPYPTSG